MSMTADPPHPAAADGAPPASGTPKRSSMPVALEVLHPITWFAPMWAFTCGVVSSGQPIWAHIGVLLLGITIAGPMVCGTSQAANDWFDRHVDAINEPHRPIPSGRLPGRSGLYIAIGWSVASLVMALGLGRWGFGAVLIGLVLAWAYSMPPARLKQNGWWGNLACGAAYEGLPWITGAAVMLDGPPNWKILVVAALYSLGAHGIMTLNDFKSVEGDLRTGINSLPAMLGVKRAGIVASLVMAIPQVVVVALLASWHFTGQAIAVSLLLAAQIGLMIWLMGKPKERAPAYNGSGTTLYVIGMMITAFALRP
ncbi:chlorophyll synthase ChlG [Rhodopila globiformis]